MTTPSGRTARPNRLPSRRRLASSGLALALLASPALGQNFGARGRSAGLRRSGLDRDHRSYDASRLRRPEQPPLLEREARGLREQDRRASRREAPQKSRLHILSRRDGLRAQHAERASLRRHSRLAAGQRRRSADEPLLSHDLRARDARRFRSRGSALARRSAPQGARPAHRIGRQHAARQSSRAIRPAWRGQALSADGGHALRLPLRGDDLRPRERRPRRGAALGALRRLSREDLPQRSSSSPRSPTRRGHA